MKMFKLERSLFLCEYFQFQSNDEIDTVMLVETIFCGLQATLSVFVCCELGHRYSDTFSETADAFDQFVWYLFPSDVKRILPTAILYIQQPINLEFFGRFSCDREQFKRVSMMNTIYVCLIFNAIILMRALIFQVIKNVYSYFMAIREIFQ